MIIKEIKSAEEISSSAAVLRQAFATVAEDFGLTESNCPTNSAFIKEDSLRLMTDKGVYLFGLFEREKQVGFVAVEKSTDSLFYLEKLAVVPSYRHKGYGKILMDYASGFIKKQGGKEISIGIINENSVLKAWYEHYGFREAEIKTYTHLPFTVCIMKKYI